MQVTPSPVNPCTHWQRGAPPAVTQVALAPHKEGWVKHVTGPLLLAGVTVLDEETTALLEALPAVEVDVPVGGGLDVLMLPDVAALDVPLDVALKTLVAVAGLLLLLGPLAVPLEVSWRDDARLVVLLLDVLPMVLVVARLLDPGMSRAPGTQRPSSQRWMRVQSWSELHALSAVLVVVHAANRTARRTLERTTMRVTLEPNCVVVNVWVDSYTGGPHTWGTQLTATCGPGRTPR